MEDTDSDTMMIVAGLVLSAITAVELYTSWKDLANR